MTKEQEAQCAVDSFNEAVTVGTMLDYWRGAKEGAPSGTGKLQYPAHLLNETTPVVYIEGCRGCVAVTHVQAADHPNDEDRQEFRSLPEDCE